MNLTRVALLAVLVGFAGATQDIAIDAWRIEVVDRARYGVMAAAYQWGFRGAMITAGALPLFLAEAFSWNFSYAVMAAIMFVAIGAVEWLTMARIVRGQILSLKRMEFIEAARSLGLGKRRIIFRHMIPNIMGPIIVYTTLTIPAVMLLEAFLSFLGLGVQPPLSSWGVLIKDGAEKMEEFPWLLIFPGTLFSLTLFSLNFLGDGLRDALDVRASKD